MDRKIVESIKEKICKDKSYTILFIGDSITSANFIHPNWREMFEDVVKEEMGCNVGDWGPSYWNLKFINSSLDGGSSNDFLKRFNQEISLFKSDLVIIMLGINDFCYKIKIKDSIKNLERIIKILQGKKVKIVFSTPPASNKKSFNHGLEKYVKGYNKSVADLADISVDLFSEFKKIKTERFFTIISEGNSVLNLKEGDIDYVHLNQLGQGFIAKILLREIFEFNFNFEKYINDLKAGRLYPSYK